MLGVALLFSESPAQAGCNTKSCEKRVAKKQAVHRHFTYCNTWRCVWRQYRRHPMPTCTWLGESGGDYRARNPNSTAGGKYQIIDSTWYAFGGSRNGDRYPAAAAPAVEQELIARRILADGLHHWVLC